MNPFKQNGKALVAIVYGSNPSQMLPRAMGLLGGLDRLDLHGKRVLLKPNVLNDRPPPTTTNPKVIGAMVRLVKKAGAADVIVADGSGVIRLPTSDNMTRTGMRSAARTERRW